MNETAKPDRLARLEQQRLEIERRIRKEREKVKAQERRDDTRRKVIAGAIALAHMESDENFRAMFSDLLDRFVERPQDRKLLGLPEKAE